MAQVSFSGAQQPIHLVDQNLVKFGTPDALQPYAWSWLTPTGHDVDTVGTGLAYDPAGKAVSGKVTELQIDYGNNDFLHPDILITGLNVDAFWLDNSASTFWNVVLAGDDLIDAIGFAKPGVQQFNNTILFGDDLDSRTGASRDVVTDRGGNDEIRFGDARYFAMGDVYTVAGDVAGGLHAVYEGGDDRLFAAATGQEEQLMGDAYTVGANAVLYGGDDILQFAMQSAVRFIAIGDAFRINGGGSDPSLVVGGNDTLQAFAGSTADIVGDVAYVDYSARVNGGNDTIIDSEQGNRLTGDVLQVGGTSFEIRGGADNIAGYGGDDVIAGDVLTAGSVRLVGGNDVVYGGAGNDRIWGELGTPITGNHVVTGGNDQLYGEDGNDQINGQTGADKLFGASDLDLLDGGAGNDLLDGGSGDDQLFGRNGQDRLRGGIGNDQLTGGTQGDTFEMLGTFGHDQVLDFQNGVDKFDLAAGLKFTNLTIAAADLDADGAADDVRVLLTGGQIDILNTGRSAIDAGDFVF